MCEFAATSPITRKAMIGNQGIEFYTELLVDPKNQFHIEAFEAIAACLQDSVDRKEVEKIIFARPFPIRDIFVNCLTVTAESQLNSLLDSLLKIITNSATINKALGSDQTNSGIVFVLKQKLNIVKQANAKLSLLRTLHRLKASQSDQFLKQNNLTEIITKLAKEDPSMLVKSVANGLLDKN